MKKSLFLVLLVFIQFGVYAQKNQNADYIITFRNAQKYYDAKDYGNALKAAEDSILYKKNQINSEVKRLETSLDSRDVKSVGTKIDKVLLKLEERGEKDCIQIINKYLKKYGVSYFENSITNVVNFIKTQEKFPEAEKIIGDIYKLEGEYTFADEYYRKAIEHADVLDIPDEKYEILYTMADLSRLTGDKSKMEQRLLTITGKQNVERNNILIKNINNTINKNNKNALNKFFELFRSDDYYSISAYALLSEYYEDEGYLDKAIGYCSLAIITGFTKMDSIICKRNLTYSYTNVQDFFEELQNYEDLINWGTTNKIWSCYNRLASLCEKKGCNTFALELYRILSKYSPEVSCQKEAVLRLDNLLKNQ